LDLFPVKHLKWLHLGIGEYRRGSSVLDKFFENEAARSYPSDLQKNIQI